MMGILSRPGILVKSIFTCLLIFTICWLIIQNFFEKDELILMNEAHKLGASSIPNLVITRKVKLIFNGSENARQKAVVDEFLHAWNGYRKYAWAHDELKPVTKGWIDWMGVGLTIIDSLDTMFIMGLENGTVHINIGRSSKDFFCDEVVIHEAATPKLEFDVARDWVASNLAFNHDGDVSAFEVTIRVLGGLLSAFHLSQDQIFLGKALLLGETLLPCFNVSASKAVPCNRINLKRRTPYFMDTSAAEAGTLQLELRDLSRSSGFVIYEKVADAISLHLHSLPKINGLAFQNIAASDGQFLKSSALTAGGGVDSYYEYLLKQWIQTGKTKNWLKDDYLAAIDGIQKHLLRYTHPSRMAFLGSYNNIDSSSFATNMEHLSCFLPGTLVLGVLNGLNNDTHLALAANLTNTCYEMYQFTQTALSADVVSMNISPHEEKDMYLKRTDQRYVLRPEVVESLFYMYVATRAEHYREKAWLIFDAIRRHARVDAGYATVEEVDSTKAEMIDGGETPRHADQMETFFLAETLKYLYLIFSDDPMRLLPLDKFVFNTEAHPLPIYSE